MKPLLSKEEYHASLPTKRAGVAVLFFDGSERLLVVKPNYREDWQVPGGTVDKNESPRKAAIREVKEEIGIEIKDPIFLLVEYKGEKGENPDFIEFMFFGGVLNEEIINEIKLGEEELSEFKFVEMNEALRILRPSLQRRIPIGLESLKTGKPIYMEF